LRGIAHANSDQVHPMTTRITTRRPDDWHLHIRDHDMMRACLSYTARVFGRAICMPNLLPPVRTMADGIAYRERITAALPKGSKFKPLITCYLTDDTDPDDVERSFREGVFTAVKMYPANATTNSAAGVTDYQRIERVLARMEKIGMRFLIHCEEVLPDVDVFDREAVFIERRLIPMTRRFPGLRIVHEHLSSKIGVDYIRSAVPA
jgi:dihydroorotase